MISYSIMAHPSRQKNVDKLLSILGDVPVSMDYESKGLLWNCVESWKLHNPKAEFHCVLQDDVELASDFREKAEYHVLNGKSKYGELAYIFCLMNRKRFKQPVKDAIKRNADHILLNNLHTGNSICLATKHINDMLSRFNDIDVWADDQRINHWVNKRGLKVYIPIPNIVNHLNIKSLHSHNKSDIKTRVSINFDKS